MADKLVTIAEYMDSIQAEIAVQRLTNSGVRAILSGQYAANIYAGVPAIARIQLQVMESNADEARQILEAEDKTDQTNEPQEQQEQ